MKHTEEDAEVIKYRVLIGGTKRAINSVAKQLESVAERLPLENAKKIVEYDILMDAIGRYKDAVCKEMDLEARKDGMIT